MDKELKIQSIDNKNRLSYVSGMKAFMLLLIFVVHAGVRANQISQRACDFLFVTSGYLMAYKYFQSDENIRVLPYIKNKLVKFYPLYFICCIVCAIFFEDYNAFHTSLKSGVYSLGLNLTLIQSWFGDPYSFNSPSWFLSCLFGVYFIAPFTLRFLKKKKSIKRYVLLFVTVWIVRFLLEYFNGKFYDVNIYHFPIFSMLTSIGGMLIYPLSKDIKGNYVINSILEIMSLVIVAWLAYYHVDDVCITIQVLFVWASFYFFILNNDVISSIMRMKMWNILSKVQMEFYLLHQVVIRFLAKTWIGNYVIVNIIISFIITYFIASLYNSFLKKHLELMCIALNKQLEEL